MPLAALGLVLASCVLHAFWNLLFKQARDKLAFTALFLSAAPVLYLPLFILASRHAAMPRMGWLCVLGTALAYLGYFVGLARAYSDGDLSIAYPISRGSGPALAALWGVLLLGERPSILGGIGIALIIGGIALIYRPVGGANSQSNASGVATSSAVRAAFFTGLMISFYTLIDKVGVGPLHITPGFYIYLTYTGSALLVIPWVIRKQGAAALRAEWKSNRWRVIAVAALNPLSYLLYLIALSLPTTPIAYMAPLRSFSVVFAVALGAIFLKEGGGWNRVAAGAVMVAGLTVISIRG
ncbi:MAG TPA: EamA family transporter [Armatimonadota bacterium]|nr:EamA family transporter [Armatimonadota bacterium]